MKPVVSAIMVRSFVDRQWWVKDPKHKVRICYNFLETKSVAFWIYFEICLVTHLEKLGSGEVRLILSVFHH